MVGLFLIYNTMTFSVVQRRGLFGTLRCLGVTRREIFAMVLAEAALVGVLGVGAGHRPGDCSWGRSTVGMVSQTINDLYFTTTVRETGVPVESLVKGALVGLAGYGADRSAAGLGSGLHPATGGAAALGAGEQGAQVQRLGGGWAGWRCWARPCWCSRFRLPAWWWGLAARC